MADSRIAVGASNTPSDGTTHAYAYDFRLSAAAADGLLHHADFNGGTAQSLKLYYDTATGVLGWYRQAGFGTSGKGSLVGTAGTFTVAGATWERLWVSCSFNASTGDIRLEARIALASTDPTGPTTIDAVFTDNSGNTEISWGMGGQHGGVGIAGQTLLVANAIRFTDVAYGDERYGVCVPVTILGDGADRDMTWVNGGADTDAWQAVDEATPNGSGTTDVDYIRANAITTGFARTFQTTHPKPIGYLRPEFLRVGIWHRNANLGKFTDGDVRLRTYSNTVVADVGSISDPATDSYIGGQIVANVALDHNRAQLDGLQFGVVKAASGAEAADWRISTFGAELLFTREEPPPLPASGSDIILVRQRAVGY